MDRDRSVMLRRSRGETSGEGREIRDGLEGIDVEGSGAPRSSRRIRLA
jgi:hypothetical protein